MSDMDCQDVKLYMKFSEKMFAGQMYPEKGMMSPAGYAGYSDSWTHVDALRQCRRPFRGAPVFVGDNKGKIAIDARQYDILQVRGPEIFYGQIDWKSRKARVQAPCSLIGHHNPNAVVMDFYPSGEIVKQKALCWRGRLSCNLGKDHPGVIFSEDKNEKIMGVGNQIIVYDVNDAPWGERTLDQIIWYESVPGYPEYQIISHVVEYDGLDSISVHPIAQIGNYLYIQIWIKNSGTSPPDYGSLLAKMQYKQGEVIGNIIWTARITRMNCQTQNPYVAESIWFTNSIEWVRVVDGVCYYAFQRGVYDDTGQVEWLHFYPITVEPDSNIFVMSGTQYSKLWPIEGAYYLYTSYLQKFTTLYPPFSYVWPVDVDINDDPIRWIGDGFILTHKVSSDYHYSRWKCYSDEDGALLWQDIENSDDAPKLFVCSLGLSMKIVFVRNESVFSRYLNGPTFYWVDVQTGQTEKTIKINRMLRVIEEAEMGDSYHNQAVLRTEAAHSDFPVSR